MAAKAGRRPQSQPPASDSGAAGFRAAAVGLLRALRPLQWVKNGLVLLPFLFAIDLAWSVDDLAAIPGMLLRLLAVCLAFCALSSGVYLLNDLMDREADRQHPDKRRRPIASGAVSVPLAAAALAGLLAAGLAAAGLLGWQLGLIALLYLAMNLAYSLGAKRAALLELFIVAAGYVVRVAVGAVAIGVAPSPWLFVTTAAGALFIVVGRRYAEQRLAGGDPAGQRAVLSRYPAPLLHQLLTISATAALLSYTLYTIEAENLPDNGAMLLTLPLVAFGLFRYLYLLNTSRRAEAPEQLMVRDWPLLAAIIGWVAASASVLLVNS